MKYVFTVLESREYLYLKTKRYLFRSFKFSDRISISTSNALKYDERKSNHSLLIYYNIVRNYVNIRVEYIFSALSRVTR